jgi:hypothetical protein
MLVFLNLLFIFQILNLIVYFRASEWPNNNLFAKEKAIQFLQSRLVRVVIGRTTQKDNRTSFYKFSLNLIDFNHRNDPRKEIIIIFNLFVDAHKYFGNAVQVNDILPQQVGRYYLGSGTVDACC